MHSVVLAAAVLTLSSSALRDVLLVISDQNRDQLQGHPHDRVETAHHLVAHGATDRAAQHHTGDLADHDQTQDQEQRDEELAAGAVHVRHHMGREQHAGDRAEHHTEKRQQRAQRPGPPARDGGDEGDGQNGQIQPL